jgi:glycosyltransferase involved in cell wall biosynthesis
MMDSAYPRYALITAARNEEAFIDRVLQSVTRQTVSPVKWVIVDDGSTDATPAIVSRYLADHPWIELVRWPQRRERSFAGKAHAVNAAFEQLKPLGCEVVGNLDADVSFAKDYCEFVLSKFAADPSLGVAGTIFEEDGGYSSGRDSFEGQHYVAGPFQLFRARCFEEIGGYVAHKAGGVDWIAVTTARMKGWKTEAFRDTSYFHHRHMGTAEQGAVGAMFSYGKKDYYLGGHPLWQAFRVAYRMTKRPYVVGGLALGVGYLVAFARRTERPVSAELMAFHRREQLLKLRAILKSLVRLRRVDSFNIASS